MGSEDDVKEEFKEERDPPATHEEGSLLLSFFYLIYSHLSFSFPSLSFSFFDESHLLKPAHCITFFLDRSPVGVKLSVAHNGHLCLIFKGLGPSMACQDFARYGQKKTFRSVPKLQLELSTDQLITTGLCRQPSETSDHVRLSLRLSFAVLLSLSLLSFLCVLCPLALFSVCMKCGTLRVCLDRFVEQQQLYMITRSLASSPVFPKFPVTRLKKAFNFKIVSC